MQRADLATPWVEPTEAHALMLEKTQSLEDLYVASGNKAFIVGDQNGTFPPLGYHIPGDMGGFWSHPIKMLDGFWLKLTGAGGEHWLEKAEKFVVGPGFYEHFYDLPDLGLKLTRREWIPDTLPGLVVEYNLKNTKDVEVPLEMEILVHVNLRPSWRSEEVGIRDGEDEIEYLEDLNAILAEDHINGWTVIFGTDRKPTYHLLGKEIQGRQQSSAHGVGGDLYYTMDVPAKGWASVKFFVAGSTVSPQDGRANYEELMASHPLFFEEKIARYADVANHSRLRTPDPVIDEAFLWAKLNYEILTVEAPVGRGLVSGFPEVPWFSGLDICTSAPAALAAGRFDLVKNSLELLLAFSKKWHDGQDIPHEITTLGAPFQRTSQVTLPLFVIALDQYLKWTGDRKFVAENMPLALTLLARVPSDKKGLNLLPRGAGLIERAGWNVRAADVACLFMESLRALESLCVAYNDSNATLAKRRSEDLEAVIQQAFWMAPHGVFADVMCTEADIERLMQGILKRMQGATLDQLKTHLPHIRIIPGSPEEAVPDGVMEAWLARHWVGVYPLLVGAASPEQAAEALPKMETGHYIAAWGMMMQGVLDKKVTPFGTGALACAQLRWGRTDQGLQSIKRMALSLKHEMPGAYAEYLPDQGCCVRSGAGLGMIWTLVHYIMGIRPRLGERIIEFMPRLPANWDEVCMDEMRVGELVISFRVRRGENFIDLTTLMDTRGFPCFYGCPVPPAVDVNVIIDGQLQRKWDVTERFMHGQRYMGASLELLPGVRTVRAEW